MTTNVVKVVAGHGMPGIIFESQARNSVKSEAGSFCANAVAKVVAMRVTYIW